MNSKLNGFIYPFTASKTKTKEEGERETGKDFSKPKEGKEVHREKKQKQIFNCKTFYRLKKFAKILFFRFNSNKSFVVNTQTKVIRKFNYLILTLGGSSISFHLLVRRNWFVHNKMCLRHTTHRRKRHKVFATKLPTAYEELFRIRWNGIFVVYRNVDRIFQMIEYAHTTPRQFDVHVPIWEYRMRCFSIKTKPIMSVLTLSSTMIAINCDFVSKWFVHVIAMKCNVYRSHQEFRI